jgi:hypothetical protein
MKPTVLLTALLVLAGCHQTIIVQQPPPDTWRTFAICYDPPYPLPDRGQGHGADTACYIPFRLPGLPGYQFAPFDTRWGIFGFNAYDVRAAIVDGRDSVEWIITCDYQVFEEPVNPLWTAMLWAGFPADTGLALTVVVADVVSSDANFIEYFECCARYTWAGGSYEAQAAGAEGEDSVVVLTCRTTRVYGVTTRLWLDEVVSAEDYVGRRALWDEDVRRRQAECNATH